MATLTLLPDTGHHQQQQHGHHHAKKKCTSATCCSPSRIWRSIQQLIADNNKQDLIKLCQDPNRAPHVLHVILSSRLTNDASLYPASNKHRVIQLVDDGSSGLSPPHYRATVNEMFGKTATDLNALQLALFHRKESIACYLLQSVRQYAGDKEVRLFVNHLWGMRNGSLHLACFLGMPRVVQLLLEMGVAPDAVNAKLKTPLDCCVDLNAADGGGQPSVLDCRTLIEQALLIKQGKKLSVDSSSPSIGVAAPEQKRGEMTASADGADGDTNKDECLVTVQDHDDLGVAVSPTMDNGDVKSSLEEASPFAPGQVSARVSPSSTGNDVAPDINGQDELWSLPLLLMDTPFDSGDAFASDDDNGDGELWCPPLLIMDSPFGSGDAFASDDDDADELWSPPLLIMDNPFASDPFVSEDDGGDNSTCSDDDDGLQPGVLSFPLVMDSHGKCSTSDSGGSDGIYSVTGDYSDYGYDGNSSGGTSSISCFADSGGHGDASVTPPTLDGGTLIGHSPLLFGMNYDPDPKTQGSHQAHSDPRMATVATCLRGRIRNLEATKAEHGTDTSWSQSNGYSGTGDTRSRSLYSFMKQFKANLKSNDWKALRHEPTLTERKNHDYDLMNVFTWVNGGLGNQDNPNTDRLLLMIARALHKPTRSSPFTPLNQCNFDYRTTLGPHGLDLCPSVMVGSDT